MCPKSQCIYVHPSLPCSFCRDRNLKLPCIKVRGPKTAARLALTRQIPTAIHSVISGEEVLLLEYAYSSNGHLSLGMRAICRHFAIEYGQAISCATLRHAVLALSANALPSSLFQVRRDHHQAEASRRLIAKLGSAEGINESDMFAACTLAYLASWSGRCNAEAIIHLNGCMSMLNSLSEQSENGPRSSLLDVFSPFIINFANYYGLLNSFSDENTQWSFPGRQPAFNKTVKYWNEVLNMRLPTATSSGIVRAVNEQLSDLVQMLTVCICGAAATELRQGKKDWRVHSVLEYVASVMRDADFQEALTITVGQSALQMCGSISTAPFQELECVRILVELLEAPTIWQGLSSPAVISLSWKLLETWSSPSLPVEGRIQFYSRTYDSYLLVGGMLLANMGCLDRNRPSILN